MISFQTGTNVPRLASSTNSSNVVNRMNSSPGKGLRPRTRGRRHGCGTRPLDAGPRTAVVQLALGGRPHQGCVRDAAGPEVKLLLRLRDEHLEAAPRVAPGGGGFAQQPCLARVVDEVVDETAVEPCVGPRRLLDTRRGAD